jgi:pSer/pThr/pTyr-binding forkhead associated (FHA) protein
MDNQQKKNSLLDGVYGKLLGQQIIYLLEELTTTIGRDSTCDIIFESKSISKQQATIEFLDKEGTRAQLVDNNSRNGTFLNDERVWSSKVPLKHGDIIRFGYDVVSFRFEYTNPVAIARSSYDIQDSPCESPFSLSPERSPKQLMDPSKVPAAGASSYDLENRRARDVLAGNSKFQRAIPQSFPSSLPMVHEYDLFCVRVP